MSWDDSDFDSDDPLTRYNAHQAAKGRSQLPDPDIVRKAQKETLGGMLDEVHAFVDSEEGQAAIKAGLPESSHSMPIGVVVINDYDGYFARLVDNLIAKHRGPFNHKRITVNAMPYLPDAVQFRSDGDTFHLLFYSAMHAGFGSITDKELDELAQLL